MPSLVQELQQKAHDKQTSVQEVVRQALFVAQKLGLTDFRRQMEAELNGYSEDIEIPSYRVVRTNLKGWKHIRKEWLPVNFDNPEIYEELMTCSLRQPVGDLEHLILSATSQGSLTIPLSKEQENQIMKGLRPTPSEITRFVDSSLVHGIVEKVRNRIFTWSLELEDAGVVGEGITFSEKEKQSANSLSINAENVNVIGSMDGSQIQQGNKKSTQSFSYASTDTAAIAKILEDIKKAMGSLDLAEDKQAEVEADLATLNAQIKSPNPKPTIIESTVQSLIKILETVPGQVAAAFVMQLLGIGCGC